MGLFSILVIIFVLYLMFRPRNHNHLSNWELQQELQAIKARLDRLEGTSELSATPLPDTPKSSTTSFSTPPTPTEPPISNVSNTWDEPAPQTVEAIANDVEVSVQATAHGVHAFEAPKEPNPLWQWLQEDWLLKLGAFILLLGFAWLATYAIANNWVPPIARIGFGLVAGIAIHAFGWLWSKKDVKQSAIFIALGTGIILVTTFIAQSIFGLFSSPTALGIMFLATVSAAVASIRLRLEPLAVFAVGMALVAPILASTGTANYVALFAYLFMIALGALWATALTKWRFLQLTTLIGYAGYSLPMLTGLLTPPPEIIHWIFALSGLFVLIPTLVFLHKKVELSRVDLMIAIGNAILLFFWIHYRFVGSEHVVLFIWSVILLASAYLILLLRQAKQPAILQTAVGFFLFVAATGFALDGPALTMAYAVEAGIIPLLTLALLKQYRLATYSSVLLLGPILVSIKHMLAPAWQNGFWHGDFAALAVLAAVLAIVGLAFQYFAEEKTHNLTIVAKIWLVASIGISFITLHLGLEPPLLTLVYIAACLGLIALYQYGLPQSNEKYQSWVFMLAPMFFSISSLRSSHWQQSIWHLDSLTLLSLTAVSMLLAWLSQRDTHTQPIKANDLMVVATVYLFAWVWLATHALFANEDVATSLALTCYTIVGLLAYLRGKLSAQTPLVYYGSIILGLVIARLFIVDFWGMALMQKIITCFVIGLLLIGQSFIGRNKTGA